MNESDWKIFVQFSCGVYDIGARLLNIVSFKLRVLYLASEYIWYISYGAHQIIKAHGNKYKRKNQRLLEFSDSDTSSIGRPLKCLERV